MNRYECDIEKSSCSCTRFHFCTDLPNEPLNVGSSYNTIHCEFEYLGKMNMTTLSLETSKKIYELIGEYETEKVWVTWADTDGIEHGPNIWLVFDLVGLKEGEYDCSPAYGFSELIRILPKIKDKKFPGSLGWLAADLAIAYMDSTTEKDGMAEVEDYLKKIL